MTQQFVTRQIYDNELTQAKLADAALYGETTSIDNTDSPYLILSADETILIDTTTAAVTINLPVVEGANAGRKVTIKDSGGNAGTNNIPVFPNGADTIEGLGTPLTLESDYGFITLLQTSAEWVRLDSLGTITQPEAVGHILEGDIPGAHNYAPVTAMGVIYPSDFEPAPSDTDEIPGTDRLAVSWGMGFHQSDFEPVASSTDEIPGGNPTAVVGTQFSDLEPQSANDGGTDNIPFPLSAWPTNINFEPQPANDGGTDNIPLDLV